MAPSTRKPCAASRARRRRRSSGGFERRAHLVRLREPPLLLLREDEPAVRLDVELALRAGGRDGVVTVSFELLREAHGPLVVAASGRAVEDLDAHARSVYAGRCAATVSRRGRISPVSSPVSSRRGSCERLSSPKTRSNSAVVL